jgi:hypothetical protein
VAKITTTIEQRDDVARLLSDFESANRILGFSRAIRKAGKIVAKRAKELCPAPGYQGDDPTKKPLRETIGVVVREYGHIVVMYVGPEYPAGAHGHLVEFGHQLVLFGIPTDQFVTAKPFMRPASVETRSEQDTAVLMSLKASLEKPERP